MIDAFSKNIFLSRRNIISMYVKLRERDLNSRYEDYDSPQLNQTAVSLNGFALYALLVATGSTPWYLGILWSKSVKGQFGGNRNLIISSTVRHT
jgi:hypothetical protein